MGSSRRGSQQNLRKGSNIFVEGSIRNSSYEGRDGQKRYKTEISAKNVILTGGRGRREDGGFDGGPVDIAVVGAQNPPGRLVRNSRTSSSPPKALKAAVNMAAPSRMMNTSDVVLAVSIITPPAITERVVEEAAELGIEHLWMQPGAESPRAVERARELGLNVISGGPCLLVVLGFREA